MICLYMACTDNYAGSETRAGSDNYAGSETRAGTDNYAVTSEYPVFMDGSE
jgi:hypothetical protein